MRGRIRLLVLVFAALTGAAALAGGTAVATTHDSPVTVLDHVAFGHLPSGLGTSSDFAYAYQGVHFVARVWESPAPGGGWRVDLDADVMRGPRLTDGPALHDWFINYQDRPPAEAHYIAVRVHGHAGWLARDQVFWLQRPGLAVSVSLDRSRWEVSSVVRTGWSAYEVPS